MSKNGHTIVDPAIVKHFTEHPLAAFSIHSEVQFGVLKSVGKHIVEALDSAFKDSHFEGEVLHGLDTHEIHEAHGLFWLWVLGAFEFLRTMSSAKDCIREEARQKLKGSKDRLARLRMPFAKQQPRGRRGPIKGEASVSGIDGKRKDIFFAAEGEKFWVRDELRSFEVVVESITIDDIAAHINSLGGIRQTRRSCGTRARKGTDQFK